MDIINLASLKESLSDFKTEESNYQNGAYNTFQSSYLASCGDSVVSAMKMRLENMYNEILNGYSKIGTWWDGYTTDAEGLENALAGEGGEGSILEASIRSYVIQAPELADAVVIDNSFEMPVYGENVSSVFANNETIRLADNFVDMYTTEGEAINPLLHGARTVSGEAAKIYEPLTNYFKSAGNNVSDIVSDLSGRRRAGAQSVQNSNPSVRSGSLTAQPSDNMAIRNQQRQSSQSAQSANPSVIGRTAASAALGGFAGAVSQVGSQARSGMDTIKNAGTISILSGAAGAVNAGKAPTPSMTKDPLNVRSRLMEEEEAMRTSNPSVTNTSSTTNAQATVTTDKYADVSDVELARRVWRGEFGVGTDRMDALGDRYKDVQKIVDKGANFLNTDEAKKLDEAYQAPTQSTTTRNTMSQAQLQREGDSLRQANDIATNKNLTGSVQAANNRLNNVESRLNQMDRTATSSTPKPSPSKVPSAVREQLQQEQENRRTVPSSAPTTNTQTNTNTSNRTSSTQTNTNTTRQTTSTTNQTTNATSQTANNATPANSNAVPNVSDVANRTTGNKSIEQLRDELGLYDGIDGNKKVNQQFAYSQKELTQAQTEVLNALDVVADQKGISQEDKKLLAYMMTKESGLRTNAAGVPQDDGQAYGLGQMKPYNVEKYASDPDLYYANDPYTQIDATHNYIIDRYGTIEHAKEVWDERERTKGVGWY